LLGFIDDLVVRVEISWIF